MTGFYMIGTYVMKELKPEVRSIRKANNRKLF